jgi:hypothetical protein
MIAKCRQATRRQSRLTWCIEVIAVSAVVTDTAVDIGRTKASIGMAISTAPNPAALRTANAPIITSMKKTRPSRDKDGTSRISRLNLDDVPDGIKELERTARNPGIANGNTEYTFDVASVTALA